MATAAERLKKIKEEPLLDERLPHPYREILKQLRVIEARLEEISGKLPLVVPAPVVRVPPAPGVPPPVIPAIPAISLPKEEFMNIYLEALEKHGALKFADDLYVQTVDLSVDRSTDAKIEEFPKLKGIALTIFRNNGTFDLYINEKDNEHKLNFDALTYPQTFLLDWFRLKTIFIGNTAQAAGTEAKLIAWKRLS